VLLRLS